MAPLTSLNQLQLKLKKMEDLVTTEDLSLTRVLTGGTGGPTGGTDGGGGLYLPCSDIPYQPPE